MTHITPLTVGACIDDFEISTDLISETLGQPSFVSESTMFTSITSAPLPPIGLGLSDSPSMSAYISTGSPRSDSSNSQLIWKQSANLPDPDLLRHLYEVTFLTHASMPEFTLSFQSRRLLRLPSPRNPALTPARVPFVSVSSFLPASQHFVYSSIPQPTLLTAIPPKLPLYCHSTCYMCRGEYLFPHRVQPPSARGPR